MSHPSTDLEIVAGQGSLSATDLPRVIARLRSWHRFKGELAFKQAADELEARVSRETYDAAVNRINKLEGKLRVLATECAGCGGQGFVVVPGSAKEPDGIDADYQPCEDCADIRELIE